MGALQRITVAGLVAASIVVIAGVIDYSRTVDQVPTAYCQAPPTPQCQDAYRARRAELDRLERDFQRRERVYALLAMIGLAVAIVGELNARPAKGDKRWAFSAFGVLGVGALGAGALASASADAGTVDLSPWPLFGPGLLLLAVAALGGALTYPYPAPEVPVAAHQPPVRSFPAAGSYGPVEGLARGVAVAGLVLTVLAFILAAVYAGQQPACGGGDNPTPPPGWTDTVRHVAGVSTLLAIGAGLLGLLARRWFVALLCVGGSLAAWLYVVVSSCALY